ncbi:DinB family protein [Micromonospora sp. NPDC049891]|uniref:DinB family protein n=1 Tax=Micromonospora sp. NPDC049891 TaxID=3155655 RepID=UPI00340D1608
MLVTVRHPPEPIRLARPDVHEPTGKGVPGMGDGEKTALSMFLQAQRASVLAIIEGLDVTALTTAVLPSGWTPLGLVEHLGYAERHWFQEIVIGSADPVAWPDDDHAPLTTPRPPSVVLNFYQAQCERSDAVLAATPLSAPVRGRHPGQLGHEVTDLRRVVLHMIEETARHAGHLDVVRELLDGKTGLGPR